MSKKNYFLFNGDCIEGMKKMESQSVDCIISDLPYGMTHNKWDTIVDMEQLWTQFKRIIKDDGNIILFGSQPFTSMLIMSQPNWFRYELIWEKTVGSGQLNIKSMPLKIHENICVFTNPKKKIIVYNEQLSVGDPYKITRTGQDPGNYNKQSPSTKVNDGFRHPKTIIKYSNPRRKGNHPTEKPVELLLYLVNTYSNPGDVILDCCMGHGSTGVAALSANRTFMGIDINKEYIAIAEQKLLLVD